MMMMILGIALLVLSLIDPRLIVLGAFGAIVVLGILQLGSQ